MPTSTAFKQSYARLNPRQKEAVDAIEGPVMVIAGPGTGKTNILTLRIANILAKTDVPPEAILALTYTVNGAAEMQQRLANVIGAAAYQTTITTFHGLCEDIIRGRPERFTQLVQRRVAQDADRRKIMEELFRTVTYLKELASFSEEPYYINPALRTIETLKREGVSPARLGTLVDAREQEIKDAPDLNHDKGAYKGKMRAQYRDELDRLKRLRELVPLYRDYEKTLAAKGLYDYADMITSVRDALETDEDLRLSLQEQYQYLLVDEHQDTNAAQNRIIELLASFHEQPNLFIVGDEKQAIYRFQGASLENFLYFKKRFPGVRLIVLNENYRSAQSILDAAQGIRASREPLTGKAGHVSKPIQLYQASSPDAQWYAAGRMIRDHLEAGTSPESIAVLYRTNSDGRDMAAMLAKLGVPYTLTAQLDVLDDPDISRLLLLLTMLKNYGQAGPLYEALHVPWLGVPPLEVYKLTVMARDKNPYDLLAKHYPQLAKRIAGWHTLARQEEIGYALETVVRESGCLAALVAHPQAQEKIAKLHTLYDVARSLIRDNRRLTLNDLTDHLSYVQEKGIRLDAATTRMPGRVRLMTAHSAKGLEFDHVYVVNAYDKHWPQSSRRGPLDLPASAYGVASSVQNEPEGEEQNLFYVALTRARKGVIVTWPEYDRQGKALTPSRFIALIDPTLTELVTPLVGLEEEYAKNGQIRFAAPVPTTPELADKAYLNEQFLAQGLSATALNNYLECPWKYFYRNLVRIPEAPALPLMYGNAVDRALERFFNQRGQGEKVGKKELTELFTQCAHDQPFQEHELAAALEKGTHALEGWYAQWHASWATQNMNQVRITGIPVPDIAGVTLNGKLDKIELLDAIGQVNVVDYKTGKPKSKKAISEGNYLRQLTFYRVLLDRWKDGKHNMASGVIDFIDPDDRGTWHRHAFEVTPQDAAALMEQIQTVAHEILDLSFWNRQCDDPDCRYCALRKLI